MAVPARQADGPAGKAAEITAESVKSRVAELFPPGATAPAVKPRLPAVVEVPTNELAWLSFVASGNVKRVKGELAGEEAAGFIFADLLGVELLKEEALPLGESVRKAHAAVKKREDALKSTARSKKGKLREKAAKNSGLAATLDSDVQAIDVALAASCATLRATPIEIANLPDRKSMIVEARARAAPKPAAREAPTAPHAAPPAELRCSRLRAIFERAQAGDPDMKRAVQSAFMCIRPSRCFSQMDTYFNEDLEIAEVRYKHALRRLKMQSAGEFCDWTERSEKRMIDVMLQCAAEGHPVGVATEYMRLHDLWIERPPTHPANQTCAACMYQKSCAAV